MSLRLAACARASRGLLLVAVLQAVCAGACATEAGKRGERVEGGEAAAAYALARAYAGAGGDRYDPQQAYVHLQRAATMGHLPAQVELGFVYLNGSPAVQKDAAEAFKWLQRAARAGAVPAQCMVGDFYRAGQVVARDEAAAFGWYHRAAVTQDRCAPKAQYELYVSYEAGRGVGQDLAAATRWLLQAAEAGNPRAQYTLARNHRTGHGVPKDAALAQSWLLRSREGVSPHDDEVEDEHEEGHGHGPR